MSQAWQGACWVTWEYCWVLFLVDESKMCSLGFDPQVTTIVVPPSCYNCREISYFPALLHYIDYTPWLETWKTFLSSKHSFLEALLHGPNFGWKSKMVICENAHKLFNRFETHLRCTSYCICSLSGIKPLPLDTALCNINNTALYYLRNIPHAKFTF